MAKHWLTLRAVTALCDGEQARLYRTNSTQFCGYPSSGILFVVVVLVVPDGGVLIITTTTTTCWLEWSSSEGCFGMFAVDIFAASIKALRRAMLMLTIILPLVTPLSISYSYFHSSSDSNSIASTQKAASAQICWSYLSNKPNSQAQAASNQIKR